MSVDEVMVLHGVRFPGGQFLSQVQDLSPNANLGDLVGRASGHPDPLFIGTTGSTVDESFTTTQLKTMIDLCGATFAADLSAGNTDLYYKKAKDLGVREADASTVHQRFRMARGMVYWNSINAVHRQDATLQGTIVPTYDGTNLPLVPAGSLALAGTAAAAEFFTLGPVAINGTALPGLKRTSISIGQDLIREGAASELFDTFCAVGERMFLVELESLKVGAWATYGLLGTALSSLTIYLRRRDPDGGLYSDGSSQHIAFTASAGKILPNTVTGAGNRPSQSTLRILLRATSSSSAALAANTASTIS